MNRAYVKYIVAVLLFGSNGIVAAHIDLPSTEIVLSRAFIGSLFLIAVFLISRKKITIFSAGRQGIWLAISGISMGASWMFLYEAYQQIGVSVATLVYYTGPVVVMVMASVVFHEKLTVPKLVGFLAVLAGMVCVNGVGVLQGQSAWGMFCGVMSALTYSFMVIFNKKATKIVGIENAMWQLIVACVVVALFTVLTHDGAWQIPGSSIVPMLILGVLNTGFGCYLYFSSIKELSAQSVSIWGYLEPLSALLLSAVFLGERLGLVQIVGACLILGGAAFAELYGRRRGSQGRSDAESTLSE